MTDIYGYAAAAPLYRAAGWMQVIPLPEGRKTPPPSGFTGRSRKPVTDEQIRLWSQATPDANTGIVIPEGVLVLDIDAAQGHQVKADGAKGISELSQELGVLPATWSSTAHGIDSPARHLFYKVPEGLAWKGGAIEGVDILQPGHRYSVVWPSIHPSGEMYCWYTPSGAFASTPPHLGFGDTAVEVGGLFAQARQHVEPDGIKVFEFEHFNPLESEGIRRPHVQGRQHVPQQDARQPGKQGLKA